MRTIGDHDWAFLWLAIFLVIAVAVLDLNRKTTDRTAERNRESSVAARRTGDEKLYPPPNTTGAIDAQVTQDNIQETICVSGYTRTVRPSRNLTDRIKLERMAELPGDPRNYELDHLIPLELGGCPTCESNLWMEPISDALNKDQVEDYLHREVCNNRLSLSQSQKMIAQDWYAVYLKLQDRP